MIHPFYSTTQGRRRRYRFTRCSRTFSSTTGTPYYRLREPRVLFDEVARVSVDGGGKSAIARIKRIAWNTTARWLSLAAAFARRFNDRMLRRVYLHDLQADEIRSFLLHKRMEVRIHTAIEVWSRLWLSVVVGRRTARNIRRTLQEILERGRFTQRFLLTTDGLDLYAGLTGIAPTHLSRGLPAAVRSAFVPFVYVHVGVRVLGRMSLNPQVTTLTV